MIPRATMMSRCDTTQLMCSDNAQLFMGPSRALLAYPVARGELYNIAITALNTMTRKDDARVGKWNDPVNINELKTLFHDFCPQVQVLLDFVEVCTKWTIAEVPPLRSWFSASGRVVLLGDAAHAMSPHLAQGGAMAIEDAAVLGECLELVTSLENDLPRALRCYEAIRKPRVERIAELARDNGASMLLGDGPAQEERDRRLAASVHAGPNLEMSNILRETVTDANAAWPSPPLLKWVYGFDAVEDATIRLRKLWPATIDGSFKSVEPTTTSQVS
jgi:salicylate hydroxylase